MKEMDFVASTLQPMVFKHLEYDLTVLAHVDDFLCVGSDYHLDWLCRGISERFEITRQVM